MLHLLYAEMLNFFLQTFLKEMLVFIYKMEWVTLKHPCHGKK